MELEFDFTALEAEVEAVPEAALDEPVHRTPEPLGEKVGLLPRQHIFLDGLVGVLADLLAERLLEAFDGPA